MTTVTPEGPTLKVSEAAKFFDKSVPWMRWVEGRPGLLVREDGSKIEIARTEPRRAKQGYRKYTYRDIADIADALYRNKKLDKAQYEAVKERVAGFL